MKAKHIYQLTLRLKAPAFPCNARVSVRTCEGPFDLKLLLSLESIVLTSFECFRFLINERLAIHNIFCSHNAPLSIICGVTLTKNNHITRGAANFPFVNGRCHLKRSMPFLKRPSWEMASTVLPKWHRPFQMATTVLRNVIDRFKWQRPYTKGKFAGALGDKPRQRAHDSRWEYERRFSPNYHTRQTGKAIFHHQEEFEQAQNEW